MVISIKASFAVVLLAASVAFTSCAEKVYTKYQCPMKCEKEKVYDKPGNCPVCGMEIKGIE